MTLHVEPAIERNVSAECTRHLSERCAELNLRHADIEADPSNVEASFGNQAPLADLLEDALQSKRLVGLSEKDLETIVTWEEDDRVRALCLQALQQLNPQKAESLAQRLLRERSPLTDLHLLLLALEMLLQQGTLSEELLFSLLHDPSLVEVVLAFLAHSAPERAARLLADHNDLPLRAEARQLLGEQLER
jgi:hypothetical protein